MKTLNYRKELEEYMEASAKDILPKVAILNKLPCSSVIVPDNVVCSNTEAYSMGSPVMASTTFPTQKIPLFF